MPFCFQKRKKYRKRQNACYRYPADQQLLLGCNMNVRTPVMFLKAGPLWSEACQSETLPQSLGTLCGQIAFPGRTAGQNYCCELAGDPVGLSKQPLCSDELAWGYLETSAGLRWSPCGCIKSSSDVRRGVMSGVKISIWMEMLWNFLLGIMSLIHTAAETGNLYMRGDVG